MNITELIPIGDTGWIWLSNIIILFATILNGFFVHKMLREKSDLEIEIDDLVWKERREYLLQLKPKVFEHGFIKALLNDNDSFNEKIQLINKRVHGQISTNILTTILDDLSRLQEITNDSYISSEKMKSIIDSLYILNVIDISIKSEFRKITVPFEVKKSLNGYKAIKSLIFYTVALLTVEAIAFLGIGATPFAYATIFLGLTGMLISNSDQFQAMKEGSLKKIFGGLVLAYASLFYLVIPLTLAAYFRNPEWVYVICLMLTGLMTTVHNINLIKILVSIGTLLAAIAIWSYGGYIVSILYFLASVNLLRGKTINA